MKKRSVISLLLCLLMLTAALAGCGAKREAEPSAEATVPATEAVTEAVTEAATESPATEAEITTTFTKEPFALTRDGMKLSGDLLLPDAAGPLPLVILSHGFGGSRYVVRDYAETFACHGIAACIFDFIGGGNDSQSDGDTTQMSVLTEAADLDVILSAMREDPRFDAGRIFLFGESQGGLVSTYVGCRRPDDVAGLVLLYPAYVIRDLVTQNVPDLDSIPESLTLWGVKIGAVYARDALTFDIYEMMTDYPREVLIIHGTDDNIVPIAYSERAVTTFPDAELITLEGAGHGFSGKKKTSAAASALAYVRSMIG